MLKMRSIWPAVLSVAALQTAALVWMVADRITLINSGSEIVLDVVPVDPRSLFRGDYVILNYDISRIENASVPDGLKTGAAAYVSLKRTSSDEWKVDKISLDQPTSQGNDGIVLKARVKRLWKPRNATGSTLRLVYGIEKFFVPEGKGKELEVLVRDNKIRAIIAVGRNGKAALKGIEVAGQRILDAPLF